MPALPGPGCQQKQRAVPAAGWGTGHTLQGAAASAGPRGVPGPVSGSYAIITALVGMLTMNKIHFLALLSHPVEQDAASPLTSCLSDMAET